MCVKIFWCLKSRYYHNHRFNSNPSFCSGSFDECQWTSNFFETPWTFYWIFLKKHLWNTLDTSLKLPWYPIETWKALIYPKNLLRIPCKLLKQIVKIRTSSKQSQSAKFSWQTPEPLWTLEISINTLETSWKPSWYPLETCLTSSKLPRITQKLLAHP